MEYREIGRTGLNASVIGLGCEHLDGKPFEAVNETIAAALDAGVNIMDVFMPGAEIRQHIGKALGTRRKDVMLQGHIGSTDLKQQYDISRDLPTCQKYFEDLLRHLGTDYIDFGMLFFMDSEEAYKAVFDTGIITYVQDLKKKGVIRHIGASSHNPTIAAKVVETGVLDLLMFSINPAFDMAPEGSAVLDSLGDNFAKASLDGIAPSRAKLYRLCEQQGVGITVMKTFGAAKLMSAEQSPFGKPLTSGQLIHYALSRPAVCSVLPGCQTPAQVQDCMKYLSLTDEERDYAPVLKDAVADRRTGCVYCNHCLPCPAGIDIAATTRLMDIADLAPDNIPAPVREQYAALEKSGKDCIQCRSCEKKCPFSVPVVDNMAKAARLFG